MAAAFNWPQYLPNNFEIDENFCYLYFPFFRANIKNLSHLKKTI